MVGKDCTFLVTRSTSLKFEPITLKPQLATKLSVLCDKLMEDYRAKSKIKETTYGATGKVKYREFYPKLSKRIIDEIDDVISQHYGFNVKEAEYIKNFGLKF